MRVGVSVWIFALVLRPVFRDSLDNGGGGSLERGVVHVPVWG